MQERADDTPHDKVPVQRLTSNEHWLPRLFPLEVFWNLGAMCEKACLELSALSNRFPSQNTGHGQNGTPFSLFGAYQSTGKSTQIAVSKLRVMRLGPIYFGLPLLGLSIIFPKSSPFL